MGPNSENCCGQVQRCDASKRATIGASAKPRHATLAVLLILVGIALGAVAGPLEDALAAAERGDYSPTIWLLRPLADQGNAMAQFDLGSMYTNGLGVPQNYAER